MESGDAFGVGGRFDGRALRSMFTCATRLVEHNAEAIDALNVFPVPDGDTGTNMRLTLRSVMDEAARSDNASAGAVTSAMAKGALFGARGNSGVILSQFFKGMAVAMEGLEDFGPQELAQALEGARDYAYRAVGQPVEGTVLTVIDHAARAARSAADAGGTVAQVVDSVCDCARRAVALTPTMLPVLRQAGVVDAGGHGMYVIFEGLRTCLAGREGEVHDIAPPEPAGMEEGAGVVSADFLDATDHEHYGYCTQFMVQGHELDVGQVRERLSSLGSSAVVVGDSTAVRVHAHAEDPGPLLSYGVSLGTLSHVKIENMDEQHRGYADARRKEAVPEQAEAASVAVVVVAWGEGIERIFSEFGASAVVSAGDTMNPSVQQVLEAVEATPAESVIFLPNNRNIVPAAQQAASLSSKPLRVVPTTSIPQGISAILAFNAERGLDENAAEMEQALSAVRTGEVCFATRPVDMDGISVQHGQTIGLLERKLVSAGDEPASVLVSLLQQAGLAEDELVTLYWGDQVGQEDAEAASEAVRSAFPGVDVEMVAGGQPHYLYIVSIE